MIITESLFNVGYIITYTKKTYKLILIETCFLTVIFLILKWMICISNEVIKNVKGGLVSPCKIANL